ncbi:MAG: hypothetical protein IJ739_04265 [Bacteroidaceae bacterium]|nr:hypothetical protein [Bacteroidaceae bacterium]
MHTTFQSLFVFIAAFLLSCSIFAQQGTFSVATLNADGLPDRILFIDVNEDGPGSEYTPAISRYLSEQSYDFIGVQENFNYNDELSSALLGDYRQDEFSGGIFAGGSLLNLWNLKFPCDGLSGFYRSTHILNEMQRTAWVENYGKTNHSNDDLCTKGFRRYELTLDNGFNIRLYNMHMDASSDEDERTKNDGPDKAARMKQWLQLREDILSRMDSRPVIVLGDMNSYYARDDVKTNFIDAITATGCATVSDVWIELERNNSYPPQTDDVVLWNAPGWAYEGETLDKILYINPNTRWRIRPIDVNIDRTGYVRNDGITPLGDHFPLSATFIIEDTDGLDFPHYGALPPSIYSPDGRRLPRLQRGLNIVHMSDGTTRKVYY